MKQQGAEKHYRRPNVLQYCTCHSKPRYSRALCHHYGYISHIPDISYDFRAATLIKVTKISSFFLQIQDSVHFTGIKFCYCHIATLGVHVQRGPIWDQILLICTAGMHQKLHEGNYLVTLGPRRCQLSHSPCTFDHAYCNVSMCLYSDTSVCGLEVINGFVPNYYKH